MYKILLFDLDDTLLDYKMAEDIAITRLLENENVKDIYLYKDYYNKMNKQMWKDFEKKLITREELVNTRFFKLFKHFNIEVDGIELAQKYQALLKQQGHCFEGALELLQKLSLKHDIYAATNGISVIQKGRLKVSQLEPYFKKVFISEEIGHNKPEKGFFDYIKNNVRNFNIKETLMIGDNLYADIHGANSYGIDTVYFNPDKLTNESDIQPTYTISGYHELFNIV